MDRNKHNDWTDAVRKRLEGRELTPSEQLWERIGAALPEEGAAARVRRLPAWAGAVAAAAAAVAAVLLLRPAGAPEPGRVELVPADSPALAQEVEGDPFVAPDVTEEKVEGYPSPALSVTEEVKERIPSAAPSVTEEKEEGVPVAALSVTEKKVEEYPSTALSVTEKKVEGMSMEEYLAQESDGSRSGRRRLSAGIYAAGMASTDFLFSKDFAEDVVALPVNDPWYISNAPSIGNTTLDPENPNIPQYDPSQQIRYNDLFNGNGNGHVSEFGMVHSRPVSFGLTVMLPLGGHLFLESGAYYSWLHSKTARGAKQDVHSAGIPLKVGWRFSSAGRTSFAMSAGVKAEKCFYAVRENLRFREPGIQAAGVAGAAILYDITPSLGIYLAPELSYWFNRTQIPTYNTEHPLNLSFKAGLNITLNR